MPHLHPSFDNPPLLLLSFTNRNSNLVLTKAYVYASWGQREVDRERGLEGHGQRELPQSEMNRGRRTNGNIRSEAVRKRRSKEGG